jgi:glycosyltransferase involved in cell wall biosynthesis
VKILNVTQNYFPSVGGPQYVIQHVSEKLVEYYEDNVEVCTTNSLYAPESKLYKRIDPAVEVINGVKVHRLPFNRWHYPLVTVAGKVYGKLLNKALPFSITKQRYGLNSPAISRMMEASTADVIMAKTIIYNFADYPLWRFRTKNPKPFVLYGALHLHVEIPENSPAITRAKACDCYVSNTEYERRKLIDYGVEADKIVTIGIGVTPEHFVVAEAEVQAFKQNNGIKETDVLIGYIGRLVKGKGVPVVMDAFRKLYAENKNVKLLLAGGTTDYVPELRKIIKEEQLPVILIEDFDEGMKGLLYNTLDIFVLASQSESFGIVFLEAWVCKKPVIATRIGAIASLLSEGKDSFLFKQKDVDSLVSKLKILIANPALRAEMGLNGYQKVMDNFTWRKIIAKYRDTYELAISKFNSNLNSRQYRTIKATTSS